jgi:hypothetical protein
VVGAPWLWKIAATGFSLSDDQGAEVFQLLEKGIVALHRSVASRVDEIIAVRTEFAGAYARVAQAVLLADARR